MTMGWDRKVINRAFCSTMAALIRLCFSRMRTAEQDFQLVHVVQYQEPTSARITEPGMEQLKDVRVPVVVSVYPNFLCEVLDAFF